MTQRTFDVVTSLLLVLLFASLALDLSPATLLRRAGGLLDLILTTTTLFT